MDCGVVGEIGHVVGVGGWVAPVGFYGVYGEVYDEIWDEYLLSDLLAFVDYFL